MTGSASLSMRDVRKSFRSGDSTVEVLKGIDLDLMAGEVSALMGPSGCGKSTLLLIAGMLEKPTSGTVQLAGQPMADSLSASALREIRSRRIGFVFQKPNLIPFLTAAQNVEIVLQIAGLPNHERRRRAREMLESLDLGHRVDQLPKRLSGGEQQRVAIARALANRPQLVLADEPTAALDETRSRQAIALLRSAASREQASVLVVTHDRRSLELFDRVIEMQDGRLR